MTDEEMERYREEEARQLTEDHRILYSIVKEKGQIASGALWNEYQKRCGDMRREPIALRTFSQYMNRLAQARLVATERARVKGKVRLFRILK